MSGKNSLAAFLVTLSIGGLIVGLIVWLTGAVSEDLTDRLIIAVIFWLIVGLSVGLNRGGSAVTRHYALRLTLWLNGYAPFKFVNFLDHCAKLILLKKVGGGYFIHRMLLEYFAEPTRQSTKADIQRLSADLLEAARRRNLSANRAAVRIRVKNTHIDDPARKLPRRG